MLCRPAAAPRQPRRPRPRPRRAQSWAPSPAPQHSDTQLWSRPLGTEQPARHDGL